MAASSDEPCSSQSMNIVFINVSNTPANEHGTECEWKPREERGSSSPLIGRLFAIIESATTLKEKPDVLFLLGVGRQSRGVSWSEMAVQVEKRTNMTYQGVSYASTCEKSSGVALFLDNTKAFCTSMCRRYYSKTSDIPSGPEVDLLLFSLCRVRDGSLSAEPPLNCVVFTVPQIPEEDPREFATWMVDHSYWGSLWIGTWDTASHVDFLGTSEEATKKNIFREIQSQWPTFRAYPCNLTHLPIDRAIGMFDEIVHSDDKSQWVRRAGFFERCFAKAHLDVTFDAKLIECVSDHAICSVKVSPVASRVAIS